MNITTRAKVLVGGIALVGAVALGGTAFTGTGVTTSGQAASAQFVGGAISQSVTGATLSGIVYAYANGTNTAVHSVTLTFANDNTDGRLPTVELTNTSGATFTCQPVAVTSGSNTSLCSADTDDAVGVSAIAVTVPSTNIS